MKMINHNHFICHFYCCFSLFPRIYDVRKKSDDRLKDLELSHQPNNSHLQASGEIIQLLTHTEQIFFDTPQAVDDFSSITNAFFILLQTLSYPARVISFLLQDDIPGEYFQYPLSYTAGYFLPPSWEQL